MRITVPGSARRGGAVLAGPTGSHLAAHEVVVGLPAHHESGLAVGDVAKELGARWRALDAAGRRPFEARAAADKPVPISIAPQR